jgi:hypothetical protein
METRHIGIGLAILVIGGIFGYVIAKNNAVEFSENNSQEIKEQIVDETESGKYFVVPELRIKFKNVSGFNPVYVLVDGHPRFSSKEVLALAFKDPRFSGCITDGFSHITITTTSSNDEMILADQISLGQGKYAHITGPQAVCWDAAGLNTNQQDTDPNITEFQNQTRLFGSFLNSAQAY